MEDGHRPTLVHFDGRHSTPAEVCWTCSDDVLGRWVPVTACDKAKAQMDDGNGSLYADVVVLPEKEKREAGP